MREHSLIDSLNPLGSASQSDIWFAWYPVRTGALGTGRWVWLCKVWRNRCLGATIYQTLPV